MENEFQKQTESLAPVYYILFGVVLIGCYHAASYFLADVIEMVAIMCEVDGKIYKYFFPVIKILELSILILVLQQLLKRFKQPGEISRAFTITLMVLWPLFSLFGYLLNMMNNSLVPSKYGPEWWAEIARWRNISLGLGHLAYIIIILVALAIAMGMNGTKPRDFSSGDFRQN